MLVFLAALILVTERLRRAPAPDALEQAFLVWPHDLYLAWISVAVIANTFQVAHVIGFGGLATVLGAVMAVRKGNWTFPFVVAWALRGIGARYTDRAALSGAATALVVVGLLVGLVAIGRAVRRRPATAA